MGRMNIILAMFKKVDIWKKSSITKDCCVGVCLLLGDTISIIQSGAPEHPLSVGFWDCI